MIGSDDVAGRARRGAGCGRPLARRADGGALGAAVTVALALGGAVDVGAVDGLGSVLGLAAAASTVNDHVLRSRSPSSADFVVDFTVYLPGASTGTASIAISFVGWLASATPPVAIVLPLASTSTSELPAGSRVSL